MADLRGLFSDLVRFETELWDAVDRRLRSELDLPLSWFEPMLIIDELDGCRVHDIAEALSITAGGTSKLVDRIESAGLCERRPNLGDRRSSLVGLTAAGRKRLAAATMAFDDELARRFGALPDSTLDRFHDALRGLRAAGRSLHRPDDREAARG